MADHPERVSIAAPVSRGISARVNGRRSTEKIAARDLARYYGVLAQELAALDLTSQEAMLIHGAWTRSRNERNGQRPESLAGALARAVEAEYRRCQGVNTVRDVDIGQLLARLRSMGPARSLALVDGCERLQVLIQSHLGPLTVHCLGHKMERPAHGPGETPRRCRMHAVVRRYSGQGASQLMDVLEQNRSEVEPLIRGVPGFVAYSLIRTAEGGLSMTVCRDKAGTDESVRVARDWIQQNAKVQANPPEVSEGNVIVQLS